MHNNILYIIIFIIIFIIFFFLFKKNIEKFNNIIDVKYVIARYNEDIKWLDPIKNHCIIYNKGEKLNIQHEIIIPNNVGRESHTYLLYIIDNYYNLPNIIVFSQGKISDHIGYDKDNHLRLIDLSNEAKEYGYSKNYIIQNTVQTNIKTFNINSSGNWFHYAGTDFTLDNYKNKKIISFEKWFEENILKPFPLDLNIYWSGLFAIKKEKILSRDIDFYKKLIKELDYHNNPIEGHFFERSWFYIFNLDS